MHSADDVKEFKPNCDTCKNAIYQDYGYSNYTVEGTSFRCAMRVHPDGSFDRFYGQNPKFEYAEKCESYSNGTPINLDCDGEYEPSEEEQKVLALEKTYALIGIN